MSPLQALRRCNLSLASLDPPRPRRRVALDLVVLAALGLALLGLTLWMAHWPVLVVHPRGYAVTFLAQLAVYALAAGWVVRRRPHAAGAWPLLTPSIQQSPISDGMTE